MSIDGQTPLELVDRVIADNNHIQPGDLGIKRYFHE